MNQTRKPETRRSCEANCPCKHTGFLFVVNDGQFKSANGNVLPDRELRVLCNQSKGEWIRLHSTKQRLPTYDPETMRLPGEPEREAKPKQSELF